MVEMLGVLAIMGVLSIGSIWAFSGVMNRFRANDLLEEASARAMRISEQIKKGRKTLSLGKFLHNKTMGGTFSKQVFTSGLYQQFAIQVSDVNKSVCERVLNSITDNSPLRRLSLATSPTTPITECQDDNAFLMVYNSGINGKNKDKKYCEFDKDCDTVCGECNENYVCHNECKIPLPDKEAEFGQECGENECIVYDEESQVCKDACERVEYLESDGSQWIITSTVFTEGILHVELKAMSTFTEASNAFKRPILGSSVSNHKATDGLQIGFYWQQTWQFGYAGWSNIHGSSSMDSNRLALIELNTTNGSFYRNTGKYQGTMTDNRLKTVVTPNPFVLFANGADGTDAYPAKIWGLKIIIDGVLNLDFIPVISPDGEACMFDKVSKKLFRNSGTGIFKTNLDE